MTLGKINQFLSLKLDQRLCLKQLESLMTHTCACLSISFKTYEPDLNGANLNQNVR